MTSADLAIAVGIGVFVFLGFFEGFIKKIFGLIVLIVAFFIAIHIYPVLTEWLQTRFGWSALFSTILSFLVVFLFVLILGNVLYRVLGKRNELYKMWDRLAGSAFGFVEGAIIVSIFLHILVLLDVPAEEIRNESVLYPIIYGFAPLVFEALYLFLPQVREFFDIFIDKLNAPNQVI